MRRPERERSPAGTDPADQREAGARPDRRDTAGTGFDARGDAPCYTVRVDPTDPLLLAVRTGLEPFAELACAVLFGSAAAERATGRNVDLLFLNRAPATVCAAAVLTGTPVLLRNAAIFSRYRLAVTDVAIDFWATERDFRAIRNRSASLNEADRAR